MTTRDSKSSPFAFSRGFPQLRALTLGVTLGFSAIAPPAAAEEARSPGESVVVRFAFSKALFTDVNENDAKAAVKMYAKSIGDLNGIDTSGGAFFLDGTNEIAAALAQNQIDLISLTAEEFFTLESMGLEGPLLLPKINNGFTEEYVLLARDGGPVRAVEDLRGRGVILFSDARGSLGQTWLDVLCLEHGLGPASNALIKVKFASKGTQVILPVFFGKTDACVITRSGWEVMGELNPQVKKQLRIVAVSPPLVPVVTCFRRGFSATLMRRVIVATERSHSQVSFQQLMAIFKADEIGHQPIALLETTRQLTDARRHLAGLAPFSRVPSKEK